MATPRVLIFSLNYYPRFVGGAEIALKEITDRIPPSEIEFHLVTLRFDSSLPNVEKIGNVLVHRIGFAAKNPSIADLRKFPLRLNKFLFQLLAVPVALSLHKKYQYRMIWGMMAHATGIPAGIFKWRHPEVKYLLTLQEGDPPQDIEHSMRFVAPLFRAGFARADALQAISTFLGKWGTKMGFRGAPVVIPNGVDTARFARDFTLAERTAQQEAWWKQKGDVFLITSSRLVKKNAVDDVIRALTLLPEHIHFIICGIGPDETALKTLVKEVQVEKRVRFMGQVDHDKLPRMLAAADIFIRPSRSEGMGNSFIEAMATGIPVIATQEGGISDFLFDARRNPGHEATGFAVDANAPAQIADAVKRILGDNDATARTVATARRLATSSYDWERIAGKMKEVIASLVK
jgi:glycosyltransferase involved in cell wall biosynthesis